ncbi:InlB B-repeat-containing protein [Gracilibacillus massiliensis]|uniref:InlB B-repeat-containing protein n=1 Tax=Gracilibacillus massiliensis TaxID=1564956 RepID=UPI00071C94D0|nr:InlB B-repeat-containing protein [Gracilibacillus massiliensis]
MSDRTFSKRIYQLLCLLLIWGSITSTGMVNVSAAPIAGEGTQANPYMITNRAQLEDLNHFLGQTDVYFQLANDIDLSGSKWQPIGTTDDPFMGQFDGDGHTISGMMIEGETELGLFGVLQDGMIENLNLDLANVSYNDNYMSSGTKIGSLVGLNDNGTIKNISVSGSTNIVDGESQIGGLVGENNGTISDSSVNVEVKGESNVGGLAGVNNGTITNSHAIGNVNAVYSEAGGLVGNNFGGIESSYAVGDVNTSSELAGGLVGVNEVGGAISESFATGKAESAYYIGGLIGKNEGGVDYAFAVGDVTINNEHGGGLIGENTGSVHQTYSVGLITTNPGQPNSFGGFISLNSGSVDKSFWDIEKSGASSSNGGEGKTTEEFATTSTFQDWDSTVWDFNPGQYPKLKAIEFDDNFDVMAPAKPTASSEGGNYTAPPTINLTGEAGATIYYTLDGTEPTDGSNIYTSPITINETTILKAIQVDEAGNTSPVLTEEYVIQSNVLFESNGGSSVEPIAVEKGGLIDRPDTPTKEGYSFAGWYQDDSFTEAWDFEANTVTEDITLYAKWQKNEYNVTFESNGGNDISMQQIQYNEHASEPAQPEREHYQFIGWYSDEALTEAWDFEADKITENITLYAKWEKNIYNVVFNSNGGGDVSSQQITYNEQISEPEEPERAHYQFTGWYQDKELTKRWNFEEAVVTKDLTLYAAWEKVEYEVTFDSNHGSTVSSQQVKYNEQVSEPEEPERAHYQFAGWYKDESLTEQWNFEEETVTEELTLYAKWNINQYYVTFINYGGETIQTETVNHGESATSPEDPIRVGYTFTGWSHSFDNITSDLTIQAEYEIKTYTVSFKDYDGTELKTETVAHGESAIAPASPTRTGYTFVDWNQQFDNIIANLVVTATYAMNSYTISFDSNGGSEIDAITDDYGKAIDAPVDPVREGHSFHGWYVDEELAQAFNFQDAKMPAEDLTLYAKWEKNQYHVTFNSNGGSDVTSQLIAYNEQVSEPEQPERAHYQFAGWYKDQAQTEAWNFEEDVVTKDLTLYAKWNINQYDVTFINYDGETIQTETVNHGEAATAPEDPIRVGYTFTGWSRSFDNITGDQTIQAEYEIKTYTVTFEDYDGTEIKTETVEHGESATAPVSPIRTGYTFVDWDLIFDNITANTVVTAAYAINSYTISFESNGGSEIDAITGDYGKVIEAQVDPVREGHSFQGWYFDEELTQAFNFQDATMPAEDIILYAKWEKNEYHVTFNSNGGSDVTSQLIAYKEQVSEPEEPEREHYQFAGWYKDQAQTEAWNFEEDVVTEDLTLYAKWNIHQYDVTFINYDGETIQTETVNHGEAATSPEDPIRVGYNFTGWSKSFDNITSDLTIEAEYKIKTYTVTFEDYNGTELKTETVEHGESATAPASPTRTGYTFVDWDQQFDNIIANLVVTATYAINSYTISFDNNGGSEIDPITEDYGKTIQAPVDPIREGYAFQGWYTNEKLAESYSFEGATIPAEDMTLYAKWTINEYKVTFNSNGGSTVPSQQIIYNEEASVPEQPERAHYQFAGWYKDEAQTERWNFEEDVVTEDVTLYAKWNINQYDVTFINYDGETIQTETVNHGEAATAPDDPIRVEYIFTGWSQLFDYITSDQTIEAEYEIKTYTVTFEDYDGTELKTETVEHGAKASAPTSPTREGYLFNGWDRTFNEITENQIITAQYTKKIDASAPNITTQPTNVEIYQKQNGTLSVAAHSTDDGKISY